MTQHLSSSRSTTRYVSGGLFALALALGTAACGGSDGDAAGSSAPSGGSASPAATSSGAATSASTTSEAGAASCVKDSDYLSGTSTVVWTPDGRSKHQVSEVAAANKFALTAAGKLDPATVEVAVGEVFSVTLAADADGISVLTIGCDGGQTMTKGTEAGIYITTPGTYPVTSGISGDPAGTIEVE